MFFEILDKLGVLSIKSDFKLSVVLREIIIKLDHYTPENISIKSTLNKIQYSTQLILVLNQYYKKVLKFKSILVLFHINLLNQH
jgi:hypothetical protein